MALSPPLLSSPPPQVFLVPFLFFLAPRCPTCFACTPDSVHVCGHSCTLSHFPTSFFPHSYRSSSLFLSRPPLLSSPLHVPLHLSISLLCAIGTGVAPSERAVKRPYKKPQHGKERVMMKFNCSSWCTWGLALYVCVWIYEHVCVVYVFVCVW